MKLAEIYIVWKMVDHTKWLKDKHDPDDPIQKLAVWTEMTYDGPNPTHPR